MKLAFALLFVAAPAFAGEGEGVGAPPRHWYENPSSKYQSPQRFALELKFSPYTPAIDSSPGLNGKTPFHDLFVNHNDPKATLDPRMLTQIEFDYQFLHKLGSLGVGLSIGYYRRSTHAFAYPNNDQTLSCTPQDPNNKQLNDANTCVRVGDETDLNVIPLQLMLIYRFDVLANRYSVPLVPYLKAGIGYYIWVIQNGSGGVATATDPGGHKLDGAGGTWGFVLSPGLALQLDVIERGAARTMDAELGINHTYVFVELHYADISNFHSSHAMVLSDTTFNAGMAFEF